LRSEVSVLLADVFELTGAWIPDLDIAGKISLPVGFGELVEGLVGNLRDVEFVVSDGQEIVVELLKDGV